MQDSFDQNTTMLFPTTSAKGFVLWILIRLSGKDRNVELTRQILTEFGEQLPTCFRIGPIRPIEKQYAERTVYKSSLPRLNLNGPSTCSQKRFTASDYGAGSEHEFNFKVIELDQGTLLQEVDRHEKVIPPLAF